MKGDPLKISVLSNKLMTDIEDVMLKEFNVPDGHIDIGLFTTDSEGVGYAAADEATKETRVDVCYLKSTFDGGFHNANGSTMIGILSGPTVSDVESALRIVRSFVENNRFVYAANDDGTIGVYAEPIAKIGTFLAELCNIPVGSSVGFLIGPPLEAMMGVDEALTVANVEVAKFFSPPTHSNLGGAIVTGSQAACETACEVFKDTVIDCIENPVDY